MAYAMTKRGSQDNIVTYEFICDNMNDLNAIENKYKTIGTIAIVLEGESDGLEVYICGSNKEWSNLGAMGASGSNNESTGGLSIYICSQEEVSEGLPDVDDPDESTIYLVPASETSGNLYDEYIYVDGNWEKFGGSAATIDLSDYVQKTDIATQSTAGLVKVLDNGNVTFNESNQLVLTLAGTAVVKTGQSDHPISVTHQHEAAFYGLAKAAGQDMKNSENAVGTYTTEAKTAIQSMIGIGKANGTTLGLVGCGADTYGITIVPGTGYIRTVAASAVNIKTASNEYQPIVPLYQHYSVFYGLAKAAGDATQAASSNSVGTYTSDAKAAIRTMLGVGSAVALTETVSGSTPSITGQPNVTYTCGEVSTLSITPPAQGTCSVIFTSGSTATILTVPNTVKFPSWFDATSLDANTIYEIMITNGVYGSVMTWAT